MLKHIYRIVVSLVVFVVAFVFFSHNIHEEKNRQVEITTVLMSAPTFPVVQLSAQGYNVNTLHGYTTTLDCTTVRDGVIPVGDDNKININITINDVNVTKGMIEVASIESADVLENGNLKSFEAKDGVIKSSYILTKEYENAKEYALVITLVTDKGDKLKYYSRIKKVNTTHFKEIMAYAMSFHKDILDKETASNVVNYIEPDSSMPNTDLAYVNINSSLNLISYGELAPRVCSSVFPKIHEVTEDTAMVELEFYMEADTDSGTERYKVNESFRIRWTATRMYLLGYDRTMESVFDIDMMSVSANELKLGITRQTDMGYISTNDDSKFAFVRNGELWYYNTAVNEAVKVFSYIQEDTDYIRDCYDNHDIKILQMDDLGNLNFIVYGYMNSGEYEGRMGMILYKYYVLDSRIEEQVYIPINVPYNILEGYVNDFSYVNAHDVFFFSLGGDIYSYDMITDKLDMIAQDVAQTNIAMPESGKSIAWMDSEDNDALINIMNLETKETSVIEPKEGTCVRLLGSLGESVIYGFARLDEIASLADASKVVPIFQIEIADLEGNILKEYIPDNCYVTTARIEGNKVKINQVKKDSNGYFVPSGEDYIFNSNAVEAKIKTSFRLTDKTMTEWYMSLPKNVNISKKPDKKASVITQISEEDSCVIRVDLDIKGSDMYYTYAYHGLELATYSASEAVRLADDRMGLVFDSKGNLIWERGIRSEGAKIEVETINDSDSVVACMKMMLVSDHVNITDKMDLSNKELSITENLERYSKRKPINLTGAKLSQMFYYISKGRPVMAMKSSSSAVLLVAYSKNKVRFIDSDGSSKVLNIDDAQQQFESVGNVYVAFSQ